MSLELEIIKGLLPKRLLNTGALNDCFCHIYPIKLHLWYIIKEHRTLIFLMYLRMSPVEGTDKVVAHLWSVTPRKKPRRSASHEKNGVDKWVGEGNPLFSSQPNLRYWVALTTSFILFYKLDLVHKFSAPQSKIVFRKYTRQCMSSFVFQL